MLLLLLGVVLYIWILFTLVSTSNCNVSPVSASDRLLPLTREAALSLSAKFYRTALSMGEPFTYYEILLNMRRPKHFGADLKYWNSLRLTRIVFFLMDWFNILSKTPIKGPIVMYHFQIIIVL